MRVDQLARSIAATGLLNPITVRPAGQRYELLAGGNRLAACRALGHTSIPATIVQATDLLAASMRLAENAIRTNLSPVEEATQLAALVEANPEAVDGVATTIGRTRNWILDRLEILEWPPELAHHVHHKKISLAAAKRLARIQPPDLRDLRIADAANHGINARTAALWLQDSTLSDYSQTNPSESSTNPPETTYVTETKTSCFACRNLVPLERTQPIRLCYDCLNELATPQTNQQQPPPHQPTAQPP